MQTNMKKNKYKKYLLKLKSVISGGMMVSPKFKLLIKWEFCKKIKIFYFSY